MSTTAPVETTSLGMTGLAWTLARPRRAVGERRPPAGRPHIEDAVGALELRLTDEDLAAIDRIMAGTTAVGGPSPEGG